MIDLAIELLRSHNIDFGFFRLMDYLTFRALMGMSTALGLSLVWGFAIIVRLFREGYRDTSGEFLSIAATRTKQGTPTAGGVMMLLTTSVSVVLWADMENPFIPVLLLGFLYFGFVGFFDDFQKVRFGSSLQGLGQLTKTLLQLGFFIPFGLYFVSDLNPIPAEYRTLLNVPFYKHPVVDLGAAGFMVFLLFSCFAIVNAVNMADGLDGLLGTTSTMTIGVYVIFAFVIGDASLSSRLLFTHIGGLGEVCVFGTILMGSVLGFLWYNAYPAEVFMGDTGSLAIGAATALMAFFTKQELLFVIVGGIFVVEAFTSLVQEKLGYRIGRRIVHRAPFHHSMIHKGVAETKVVMRIWIMSLLLALLGLLSLKVR